MRFYGGALQGIPQNECLFTFPYHCHPLTRAVLGVYLSPSHSSILFCVLPLDPRGAPKHYGPGSLDALNYMCFPVSPYSRTVGGGGMKANTKDCDGQKKIRNENLKLA